MRRQNIKGNNVGSFGSVGKACCLGLLVLGMTLANPVAGTVYADEGAAGEPVVTSDEAPADGAVNPDEGLMTLAADASAVGISFSPTSGSTNLTPTNSAGQSAQIKVLATVNVQKSGGYSVYVKSNSQNLVGQKSSANVIPGLQGAATYANIPVNTWGYAAKEGTVIPDNATYKAISTSGNGDKIAENTSNKITSDTKTIALSFAAKINDAKPADTYKNTVTMSVVSSPMAVGLMSISNMQEMTSSLCAESSIGDTTQLKDTRDGKYYWVTKLADGKCWMTQNLDLDLSTSKALTSADSDVSSNWTPNFTTATTASSSTINTSNTGQNSWSLGNYRMKDSVAASGSDCGYPKNDASQCTSQFEAYTTPTSQNGDTKAHYILGNHYQWNAATAGTGGTITSGQATSSICPKGWKLPESNSTAVGSFGGLINAASIGSTVSKLTGDPNYFVRGGSVTQLTDFLFYGAGNNGSYWSSTPNSNYSKAYLLNFYDTAYVLPSNGGARTAGFSVRCLAR